MIKPEKIEELLYIPDHDKSTPVKKEEARFIYDFIIENNIKDTLEIGLGYGRSATYIMAATGSKHIAIDPFQQHYENQALKNIDKTGLTSLFNHIANYSHFALPELCREGKKYDFIFIDGDHKFDGILVDFYFSSMLLKPGGFILFHDTWMRATQLVTSFIGTNRNEFNSINTPLKNLHLLQKSDATDKRDGMFFREFYTLKHFFKYRIINYVNENPDSGITRLLNKLK